jgi:hypothetical protein
MHRHHSSTSRPQRRAINFNRVSLIVVVVAITSILVWLNTGERVPPVPMMQLTNPGPP